MNFTLVGALFKLHFVTPVGFVKLMYSFVKEGLTLMSILRFSSYYYANEVAFVSEGKQITYGKLYAMAVCLTRVLRSEHCISKGMRVGVLVPEPYGIGVVVSGVVAFGCTYPSAEYRYHV